MRSLPICILAILLKTCLPQNYVTYLPGDVLIGGLFEIQGNKNGKCSGIDVSSIQHVEAVKWVFQSLNDKNYIPGVTLGFQALPTCRDTAIANNRTLEFLMRKQIHQRCNNDSEPIAGIIGPEFSSEAESTSLLLSSIPVNERLLQIGFSTTASTLNNHLLYVNFYRVIPSDEIQVKVMIALMKRLRWNYVAIIYEDDVYGIGAKTSLVKMATEENICIARSFPIVINNGLSLADLTTILDTIIQKAITGVVYFGTRSRANALLKVADTSIFNEKPTFIFSEGTDLREDLFVDENKNAFNSGKGSFVVNPPLRHVEEFEAYWKSLFANVTLLLDQSMTNPWLLEVFKDYAKCTLNTNPSMPGCPSMTSFAIDEEYKETLYTSYAIETALVFSKLLKEMHYEICGGQSGHCPEFISILRHEKDKVVSKLDSLNFNFKDDFPLKLKTYSLMPKTTRFQGHLYTTVADLPIYEVHHFRVCPSNNFCLEKIGNWTGDGLSLDTHRIKDYRQSTEGKNWPDINKAECAINSTCAQCLPADLQSHVYFDDGDLLVVGIVPIYDRDTNNPLGCDAIRPSLSVEIEEGLLYAVKTVNDKSGIFVSYFSNKKIGAIIINSCNQNLATQNRILRLLQDGVTLRNGTVVPVAHKIIGFVGAYGSGISMASSEILSPLGYVQVSYASTNADLSDRVEYSNFLRVCTPDDKQANVMMKIVKELDSDYIQILYSEGAYGEGGNRAVNSAAKRNGICIANQILVKEGKYYPIIDELRKNPGAKIVIVFLRSHVVKDFTKVMDSVMTNSDEFMFIGSEAWGANQENINGRKRVAGSLVVALQMNQRLDFANYLNNRDPATYSLNPWFKHYVETKYKCHIRSSFNKSFTKTCDTNLRITRALSGGYYTQEHWTPFAINAMFSLLMGGNQAFNDLCGSNAQTLCPEFKRKPETVWKRVSEQKLDILGTGTAVPVFDSNGDGTVGYKIFNVQKDQFNTQNLKYTEVGQAPIDDRQFEFDKSKLTLPDNFVLPSNCPNPYRCGQCFGGSSVSPPTNNNYTPVSQPSTDTTTVALGVIVGLLAVGIVVLIIIVVCQYRGCVSTDEKEDLYIRPVPTEEFIDRTSYEGIRESRVQYMKRESAGENPDITNVAFTLGEEDS